MSNKKNNQEINQKTSAQKIHEALLTFKTPNTNSRPDAKKKKSNDFSNGRHSNGHSNEKTAYTAAYTQLDNDIELTEQTDKKQQSPIPDALAKDLTNIFDKTIENFDAVKDLNQITPVSTDVHPELKELFGQLKLRYRYISSKFKISENVKHHALYSAFQDLIQNAKNLYAVIRSKDYVVLFEASAEPNIKQLVKDFETAHEKIVNHKHDNNSDLLNPLVNDLKSLQINDLKENIKSFTNSAEIKLLAKSENYKKAVQAVHDNLGQQQANIESSKKIAEISTATTVIELTKQLAKYRFYYQSELKKTEAEIANTKNPTDDPQNNSKKLQALRNQKAILEEKIARIDSTLSDTLGVSFISSNFGYRFIKGIIDYTNKVNESLNKKYNPKASKKAQEKFVTAGQLEENTAALSEFERVDNYISNIEDLKPENNSDDNSAAAPDKALNEFKQKCKTEVSTAIKILERINKSQAALKDYEEALKTNATSAPQLLEEIKKAQIEDLAFMDKVSNGRLDDIVTIENSSDDENNNEIRPVRAVNGAVRLTAKQYFKEGSVYKQASKNLTATKKEIHALEKGKNLKEKALKEIEGELERRVIQALEQYREFVFSGKSENAKKCAYALASFLDIPADSKALIKAIKNNTVDEFFTDVLKKKGIIIPEYNAYVILSKRTIQTINIAHQKATDGFTDQDAEILRSFIPQISSSRPIPQPNIDQYVNNLKIVNFLTTYNKKLRELKRDSYLELKTAFEKMLQRKYAIKTTLIPFYKAGIDEHIYKLIRNLFLYFDKPMVEKLSKEFFDVTINAQGNLVNSNKQVVDPNEMLNQFMLRIYALHKQIHKTDFSSQDIDEDKKYANIIRPQKILFNRLAEKFGFALRINNAQELEARQHTSFEKQSYRKKKHVARKLGLATGLIVGIGQGAITMMGGGFLIAILAAFGIFIPLTYVLVIGAFFAIPGAFSNNLLFKGAAQDVFISLIAKRKQFFAGLNRPKKIFFVLMLACFLAAAMIMGAFATPALAAALVTLLHLPLIAANVASFFLAFIFTTAAFFSVYTVSLAMVLKGSVLTKVKNFFKSMFYDEYFFDRDWKGRLKHICKCIVNTVFAVGALVLACAFVWIEMSTFKPALSTAIFQGMLKIPQQTAELGAKILFWVSLAAEGIFTNRAYVTFANFAIKILGLTPSQRFKAAHDTVFFKNETDHKVLKRSAIRLHEARAHIFKFTGTDKEATALGMKMLEKRAGNLGGLKHANGTKEELHLTDLTKDAVKKVMGRLRNTRIEVLVLDKLSLEASEAITDLKHSKYQLTGTQVSTLRLANMDQTTIGEILETASACEKINSIIFDQSNCVDFGKISAQLSPRVTNIGFANFGNGDCEAVKNLNLASTQVNTITFENVEASFVTTVLANLQKDNDKVTSIVFKYSENVIAPSSDEDQQKQNEKTNQERLQNMEAAVAAAMQMITDNENLKGKITNITANGLSSTAVKHITDKASAVKSNIKAVNLFNMDKSVIKTAKKALDKANKTDRKENPVVINTPYGSDDNMVRKITRHLKRAFAVIVRVFLTINATGNGTSKLTGAGSIVFGDANDSDHHQGSGSFINDYLNGNIDDITMDNLDLDRHAGFTVALGTGSSFFLCNLGAEAELKASAPVLSGDVTYAANKLAEETIPKTQEMPETKINTNLPGFTKHTKSADASNQFSMFKPATTAAEKAQQAEQEFLNILVPSIAATA